MDRLFFEQLAMPLFDQLFNHACWLTGDRADAEDLVQETYAKALKGFGSFAEGTNLRAWMFKILRNAFLNSRSGLKRNTSYLEDEETGADEAVAHDVTPEALLLATESQEAVFSALEKLPVAHREIILLCDVDEMSYREIAQVLDVPAGTVMSRLARARRKLRVALGAKEAVR
jgi:RNA polymerase sigma-70 factor (ECF subfamily)